MTLEKVYLMIDLSVMPACGMLMFGPIGLGLYLTTRLVQGKGGLSLLEA